MAPRIMLEEKYQKVLCFIISYIEENGYSPCVREICGAMDNESTATASRQLQKLSEWGFIKFQDGISRSIEVLFDLNGNPYARGGALSDKGISQEDENLFPEMVSVPVVGTVTAGTPILAVENIESRFPLPLEYTHDSEVFMLHVKGDSMINAGIYDKDLILVRKQEVANNGDYVVAMIDDSVTVKTFYYNDGVVTLKPENDTMAPFQPENCLILGKVIGLYRRM